ncbi:helix-turn-helix transcriptional regulator [Streptomyces europaeiscabiei]|uniref:helix-turn-helix transcriptional regulator n=2 Tax=Streptomyces europaeiscabiei TaxID=146819 RepID=UPI000765C857|nr:YafY family protein [Streptomyces europaeiscabiei]MDX2527018.1 YafY family protein [Streptomyces europaeiscabiei]MDX2757962.1 YafY family protein [Streptomyces europaeiscabiei]MDX3665302.1 YafY family protein [Streptomyces europaeiscabiei]MDX3707511.1 YafY family protein [Streptomyces europaeiscabiei]MDX3835562.1 YafY family protein [Streptomyces europaeiscabiei]
MKAGRLVSILLLLQTRGRMTAAQLAEELEVSVRTVYRDVEALGAAGVPLYGDAGHAGGYRLLDGYRTRLTGLTRDEAEALFLAGAPGPAAELGLGAVLAAAQLKVRAALPVELRAHADRVAGRFHLDAPGWYAEGDATPFLPAVAGAVWSGRVLHVLYRRWAEPTEVRRRLEPYGLVLKAGRWYVVAGPGPRTYRVDQILELDSCEEEFTRPDGFDLAAYWTAYQRDFHARLRRGEALVRLAPGVTLPRAVRVDGDTRGTGDTGSGGCGGGRGDGGAPGDDGWTTVSVPIESVEHAHGEFLRLGAGIEVLEPAELRGRIARTVAELAERYGNVAGTGGDR